VHWYNNNHFADIGADFLGALGTNAPRKSLPGLGALHRKEFGPKTSVTVDSIKETGSAAVCEVDSVILHKKVFNKTSSIRPGI